MQERELTLPKYGSAPETPAFAAISEAPRRGVVIIHEIFGRQPEIDRVVRRFAAAGYAAVAPDLFHRGKARCLQDTFAAMKTGEGIAVDQARGARAWLVKEYGLEEKHVALIGFCFGGGFALLAGRGWGAVSTNYGLIPSPTAMRGIGPVIGCYGGRDRIFAAAPGKLKKNLGLVGVTPEVHLYENAGHSFLTDGSHPVAEACSLGLFGLGDTPAEREDGWSKIFGFFERHL